VLARIACALALAATSVAHAQDGARPGSAGVLDLAIPVRAAALRIRATARTHLIEGLAARADAPTESSRDVLIEQAIGRYDATLAVFPRDVDALIEDAHALSAIEHLDADGHPESFIARAIERYEAARALDPHRDEASIAFQLAVLHAQRREFAAASAEYERAYGARALHVVAVPFLSSVREGLLASIHSEATDGTLLANWAEATMLAGDPQAAIERYRAALAEAAALSDSAALTLWGLALAEERAGSHADAIESALRAIDADHSATEPARAALVDRHGHFALLHVPGVFFEPACEIHAYESLGHEALATRASTAEGRAAEWTAARLSARFFLAEGGRASIYASTAEAAEARLTSLLAR
jgi:tetratricopeptide (TPR) repeat protein